MDHILRGVRKFHDEVFPKQQQLFKQIATGQKPRALFITCSDSRVHPNLITQTEPGDLFILRNPGNIIPPYHAGNDSESATIEYAISVLDVEDIIVCGHSNCGAMTALLDAGSLKGMPSIVNWLHHAEGTRRIVEATMKGRPHDECVNAAIEQNVLVQLDHLRTHPAVTARLATDALRLHAWVYDIGSGDVSVHQPEQREFVSLTRNSSVHA
jgi:carbonic anhydrase